MVFVFFRLFVRMCRCAIFHIVFCNNDKLIKITKEASFIIVTTCETGEKYLPSHFYNNHRSTILFTTSSTNNLINYEEQVFKSFPIYMIDSKKS